ncbi:DNA adenine methylase [Streptomyces sp. NPDC054771]
MMKSPVPYFGAKGRTAPWIVSVLPPHQHYVEPYCGGLSVLLAKTPSPMETVNDLELARRIWCRLAQGRAGTLRATGWRHYIDPAGSATGMPDYMAAYVDRLAAAAERLRRVSLESLPALDLIAKYGQQPDVLLYVDPPYLGTTRPWSNYRIEMKDEPSHRDLAAALADCKAAVVLSGYASSLYDGWHRADEQTMTGSATEAQGRTEVLWSNRVLAGRMSLFGDDAA